MRDNTKTISAGRPRSSIFAWPRVLLIRSATRWSPDFSRRFIDPRNVTSFIFILLGDFQAYPLFASKNSPLSLPGLPLLARNLSLTILAKNRSFHFPCNGPFVTARRTTTFNDRKNTPASKFQITTAGRPEDYRCVVRIAKCYYDARNGTRRAKISAR